MKKLLVMVMAVLAITACSDDDNVLNPTGGTDNGAAKYMAINIMSNSTDTRAVSDETDESGETAPADGSATDPNTPVFAAGDDNEYAVDNILFYFFDANGEAFDVNTIDGSFVNYREPTFVKNSNISETDNVTLTKSYVAIESNTPGTTPLQVVALLNYKDIFTPERLSLKDLKEKIILTAESTISNSTYLMMSNSVYLDKDGNEVYSTPITSINIQDTQTDADKEPVNIYVERVSAKVTTKYNIPEGNSVKSWGYSEDDPNPIFPLDVTDIIVLGTGNGGTTNAVSGLQVKILGYNLINKARSTTLEKNISGYANFPNDWNDADNRRSYWATTNLKTSTTEGVSYKVTNDKLSYKDIGEIADAVYYPLENTEDAMNTGLIFAAQILNKDGEAFPLVKMLSTYYTPAQAKEAIASYLSGQLYTTAYSNDEDAAAQTELAPSDIVDFVAGDKYYATITLKDGSYYGKNGTEALTTDAIQEILAKLPKIMYWNDGKCYYYTTITHLPGVIQVDGKDIPGVVRNHWYELTVTNIVGLGTPVADPDEVVTPEHPTEEEWYLSTQINLLSWRKDSQSIELNSKY